MLGKKTTTKDSQIQFVRPGMALSLLDIWEQIKEIKMALYKYDQWGCEAQIKHLALSRTQRIEARDGALTFVYLIWVWPENWHEYICYRTIVKDGALTAAVSGARDGSPIEHLWGRIINIWHSQGHKNEARNGSLTFVYLIWVRPENWHNVCYKTKERWHAHRYC